MKNLHHFLKKPEGKLITGLSAVILLLMAYYFYATNNTPAAPKGELIISETDHVRGALDGTVTLVEFGDFQCPACASYEPIVQQVLKDNPKNLKFVFKHFPLYQIHRNAILSAKASEAAGLQGTFWEMHDLLYLNQKEWAENLKSREVILSYASKLNLDVKKFSQDLDNKSIEDKIMAEYKEGVNLGVQGTPTFFLNGKKINNPRSIEEFNKLIKESVK